MERTKSARQSNAILEIVKGVVFAILISMILIIVLAVIIRFTNIPDKAIMPINQIVKVISIFLGTLIALKGSSKGLIKGLIIGALFSILSYFIFSILSKTLTVGVTTITDLLFSSIIGMLSGLIVVNVTKK